LPKATLGPVGQNSSTPTGLCPNAAFWGHNPVGVVGWGFGFPR
jgi:hypothetical protein